MKRPTISEIDEGLMILDQVLSQNGIRRSPARDKEGVLDPDGVRRRLVHLRDFLLELREECVA